MEDGWPVAARAGRASATTVCLALFVAGVTLDDCHVFRLPMIYVGALAAVAAFAFAPPWIALRVLSRVSEAPQDERPRRLDASLLRRRALLGLTIVAFLGWLVLFSSGRTPRW